MQGVHGAVQEENSNQTELNQKLIQLFRTDTLYWTKLIVSVGPLFKLFWTELILFFE
jgi:hypothetical protein